MDNKQTKALIKGLQHQSTVIRNLEDTCVHKRDQDFARLRSCLLSDLAIALLATVPPEPEAPKPTIPEANPPFGVTLQCCELTNAWAVVRIPELGSEPHKDWMIQFTKFMGDLMWTTGVEGGVHFSRGSSEGSDVFAAPGDFVVKRPSGYLDVYPPEKYWKTFRMIP